MKRGRPKRNWDDARARLEGHACRYCLTDQDVQLAHTIGRQYDEPQTGNDSPVDILWVHPLSVIPLCGPGGSDCHGKYDARELDILAVTTYPEQGWAAGRIGLERARNRFTGQKEVAA